MANVVDLTQQPIGSVLPFLRQLISNPGPDFSGMTSDNEADAPAPVPPLQVPNQAPPQPLPGAVDFSQPLPPADLSQAPQGAPKLAGPTKAHQLLNILQKGITGALMGQAQNAQTYAQTGRNAGFGGGFYGSMALPLELQHQQLANQQIQQTLPWLRYQQQAGIQKTLAEAGKATADTNKANAEVAGMPIKQALEQAQTEASYYKSDPNSGLIDIRTGKPVDASSQMPLNADEAAVIGKQPGEMVPRTVKNMANEIVNRGIRSVSANGRQLLVDNKGNTIKDLGTATPMAVINAQMNGPTQITPEMQQAAGRVASGQVDLATALAPFRRFPGASEAFLNEVFRQNPQYNQATFGVSKKTMEYFTTGAGANELTAFRTAISHADLLLQAARALQNGDNRTFNSIGNRLQSEFGDPRMTTFNAIANAYNHEVTSAISKGHITDSEVKTGGATMPNDANFQTIESVANAYKGLMASKAQQRMVQYENGIQGKPAFPQMNQNGPTADDLLKKYPPKK